MSRKGYSIFKRGGKGPFYVAWTDAVGKRQVERASDSRAIANEIGRAKVAEVDRVKGGVISSDESAARQAGREPIATHIAAWKEHLKHAKRSAHHIKLHPRRVELLVKQAGADTLPQLSAERIQSALSKVADQHTPNTANHYRTAMTGFCRWCIEKRRLLTNPMMGVAKLAVAGDTFQRFAFTAAQLEKLYAATTLRTSRSPVSSADRAMYYRLMANTGFRRNEAASLTPESFGLDDQEQPHITVDASYSKRRMRDEQPITRDFAERLRPWLASKKPKKRVFNFGATAAFEDMFRADCAAAGITAPEGTILGIHSLRRFYITSVVRAAGLAVGQDLARHSSPALTKKYSDLDMSDYRKGLAGLPMQTKPAAKKAVS